MTNCLSVNQSFNKAPASIDWEFEEKPGLNRDSQSNRNKIEVDSERMYIKDGQSTDKSRLSLRLMGSFTDHGQNENNSNKTNQYGNTVIPQTDRISCLVDGC